MAWKFEVKSVAADPANANIVVDVAFWDEADPDTVHRRQTWSYDLDDASIARWAYKVVQTLQVRNEKIGQITLNKALDPQGPTEKELAFAQATAAYSEAVQKAQVKNLNDLDAQAAYDALVSAK